MHSFIVVGVGPCDFSTSPKIGYLCFLAPTGALEEAILSVRESVQDIMLRRGLREFLKHSKEFRGVLGQERAQERA